VALTGVLALTGIEGIRSAPVLAVDETAGTEVGSAVYPVPAGAVVVARGGKDTNPGTAAAPVRTLKRAVSIAPSGSTIVMRAGIYRESVVIPSTKRLTIQSWPRQRVWLEGSVPVAGFQEVEPGRWRKRRWTTEFDASPTYTRGAPDNTDPGWNFVHPQYPMAAHPDQVWAHGNALRQVASLAQVGPNTFFVDDAADELWIGTNPKGASVQASKLVQALQIRSAGTVVRGIGIRRYAPSVPDMGAVTVESSGIVIENVAITDSATTGLHVGSSGGAPGVVVRDVTLTNSGMLGLNASYSDNLTLERVHSENNNTERFNQSPVSGGMKIGRSRGIDVTDSAFIGNYGPGVWFDESVYDMTVTGNEMRGNAGHGVSFEISAKASFTNNVVIDNGGFGVKVNNTSNVVVSDNTFSGNDRSINLVQDDRRPTSPYSVGRDRRQPFPDPTMTWLLGPVNVTNNIVHKQRSGICMLCVEDYSQQRSAEQIGVSANTNVYLRPSYSPRYVVVWSRGPLAPALFENLTTFRSATGQEMAGTLYDGAAANQVPVPTTPS
jgi:parallel beta-helix repeat protein